MMAEASEIYVMLDYWTAKFFKAGRAKGWRSDLRRDEVYCIKIRCASV